MSGASGCRLCCTWLWHCFRFKKCKDAISAGLESFQKKDYLAAIDLFNTALELPGNGEGFL
jgi:hypothetical protein